MTISHLRGGVALIGTAAELASANPVLLARQLSLETNTGVEKIGDGTTHYLDLDSLPGTISAATAVLSAMVGTSRPQANPQFLVPLTAQVDGERSTRVATYDVAPYRTAPGELVFQVRFTVEPFGFMQEVSYVEITAANADYSQYLYLSKNYSTPLAVGSGADPVDVTFEAFAVNSSAGSDLSVDEAGAIASAAGGVFSLTLSFSYRATAV